MSREDVKAELLANNEEFRQLYDEHRQYDGRLEELRAKSVLSPEDEAEAKRIKVHKLQLKDRMELMIRDRRSAATTA